MCFFFFTLAFVILFTNIKRWCNQCPPSIQNYTSGPQFLIRWLSNIRISNFQSECRQISQNMVSKQKFLLYQAHVNDKIPGEIVLCNFAEKKKSLTKLLRSVNNILQAYLFIYLLTLCNVEKRKYSNAITNQKRPHNHSINEVSTNKNL